MFKYQALFFSASLLFSSFSPALQAVNSPKTESSSISRIYKPGGVIHPSIDYNDYFSPTTAAIINEHRYDFDMSNFDEVMEAHGGYEGYLRSLGGVFAKYAGGQAHVETVEEFQEVAEYVWGIMTLWGFDYSSYRHYEKWQCEAYIGDGSFYPVGYELGVGNENQPSNNIDEIASGGGVGMVTNCNCGVEWLLQKAGLTPMGSQITYDFNYLISAGKMITDASELQPGDIIQYFNGPIDKNGNPDNWWNTYFHVNIVGDRNDETGVLTEYDSGGYFIQSGKWTYKRSIGDWPYEWANDWVAFRLFDLKDTRISWQEDAEGNTICYKADGTQAKDEWIEFKGDYYHINKEGILETGLYEVDEKLYYADESGRRKTGWITVDGDKYYFKPATKDKKEAYGYAAEGWTEVAEDSDKKWYYFSPSTHKLSTGWIKDGDVYYYTDESGARLTGEQTIEGESYSFEEDGKLYIASVSYDMNGGTLAAEHGKAITAKGSAILINGKEESEAALNGNKTKDSGLANWDNPTYINIYKEGYIAEKGAEWNTEKDGTGISFNQDEAYDASELADLSNGSQTTKLYINWVPSKYSILYNLQGGSIDTDITGYTVETETFDIQAPEKKGFVFVGWLEEGEDASDEIYPVYTIQKGTMKNISLKAVWKPADCFEIYQDTSLFGDSKDCRNALCYSIPTEIPESDNRIFLYWEDTIVDEEGYHEAIRRYPGELIANDSKIHMLEPVFRDIQNAVVKDNQPDVPAKTDKTCTIPAENITDRRKILDE